ncbi:MAG: hypothetical protein ACI9TH_003113, partial [Kiritimatiellia bacterium]
MKNITNGDIMMQPETTSLLAGAHGTCEKRNLIPKRHSY